MRVIMASGGTGGHIYPAIAIADKLMERDPKTEILFVGNKLGYESEFVPKNGYMLEMIPAAYVEKKNFGQGVKGVVTTLSGKRKAVKIMKAFKPDVVIGTGGYASVPAILAAHSYGARIILHEQNAYPGIANRVFEKYAEKVFLGFKDASKFLKYPEKHMCVGNPVRKVFSCVDRSNARLKLKIPKDDFVVFSFAGSQGSMIINSVFEKTISDIDDRSGFTFLFGTGKRNLDIMKTALDRDGISIDDKVRVENYIDDIVDYYAASDLVISRSGALTVAEIAAAGRACILIPYAKSAGNHQYFNARSVTDSGGGILIEESGFTAERLVNEIMRLKTYPEVLREMEKASRSCANPDSADKMVDIIFNNQ